MVFVFRVTLMGLWSEFSACSVFHVMFLYMWLVAVVMSGDVGCWFLAGILVEMSWFSMMWFEFEISSSISVPLWSIVGENHVVWCAFMSAVIIEFVRFVI